MPPAARSKSRLCQSSMLAPRESLAEIISDYRSADMFNLLDLPALVFTLAAMVYAYYGDALSSMPAEERPKQEELMCIAVLLMWLRQLRLLIVFPSMAPLVRMLANMMQVGTRAKYPRA